MHMATYVKLEVLKCYKMVIKSYYIANALDDKHVKYNYDDFHNEVPIGQCNVLYT